MLKVGLLLIIFLIFMSIPSTVNAMKISKKVLFIHHSTGGNLTKEGKLRDEIKKLDPTIEFWDHSYNLYKYIPRLLSNFTHHKGLSDSNGKITGIDYNIVLSNNSPKEYADIFSRDPNDPTLKSILTYDIIIFKNCYPTTKIEAEEQLNDDIKYYNLIRDNIQKYNDKKFILLTPPPERKETTTPENSKRAKKLVDYLTSSEFSKNTSNLYIFDFYKLLADEGGYLKKEYTKIITIDSHPNRKANLMVAPIFAKYLFDTSD